MNTKEQVIQIIQKISSNESIKESDTLLGDIGLDSLGMITLLHDLESHFHIRLDESDMNSYDLVRVSDVIALAEKYAGGS